jgi:hypothetical protein
MAQDKGRLKGGFPGGAGLLIFRRESSRHPHATFTGFSQLSVILMIEIRRWRPARAGQIKSKGDSEMKTRKWMLFAGVAVALGALLAFAPAAFAQGPATGNGVRDGSAIGAGPFGARAAGGPMGGMNGVGGPNSSLVAVAADVLGIDRVDLVAELQDGASIADVAGDQVDAIVDAYVATRADRLAALVADGRLTQEQADQLLATMKTNVLEQLNQPWSPQGYGLGTPGANFVDSDGDGVCDYTGTGQMSRMGRGGRWGQ